jgi:hypothetical protein
MHQYTESSSGFALRRYVEEEEDGMLCPICQQEMAPYKEEPCYGKRTNTEYKRTYYRCEQDDTWGRMEVPVGHSKEFDQKRAPATTH